MPHQQRPNDPSVSPSASRLPPPVLIRLLTAAIILLAGWHLWHFASAPRVPEWFLRFPTGDPPVFFATAAGDTRKVRRGDEIRNAIPGQLARPLWRRIRVAPGAHLEVAMTVLCPPAEPCTGTGEFRLRARDQGAEVTLLDRAVATDGEKAGWSIAEIDLSRFAGRVVDLEFSVATGESERHGKPAPLAVWGEPLLFGERTVAGPNVLLISIDTLRPDHLGSYGYARPTSPHLDQLAKEGARFTQAISQAPWTTPSHMSLFTSLYPSTHRVNQDWQTFLAFRDKGAAYRTLPTQIPTLPELLRARGYHTFAVTGGGTMDGRLGFARGFDVYREDARKLTPLVWATLEQSLTRLQDTPFFLFVHTFEVHAPYRHLDFTDGLLTAPQREALERLFAGGDWMALINDLQSHLQSAGTFRVDVTTALYDGGIRFTDAFLGRLFDALRQQGLYDSTLIVVTSDHGEEFGDHDPAHIYNAHCATVYDELIRVPLLIRAPGRVAPGTVVTDQVELIDVTPTILELAGIAAPPAMQGRSLTGLMSGGESRKDWALSEATCTGLEWKSLRTPTFKYVTAFALADGERSGIPGPVESETLYDLRRENGEHESVAASEPAHATSLRNQLHEVLSTVANTAAEHGTLPLTDDLKERLRALGYHQ